MINQNNNPFMCVYVPLVVKIERVALSTLKPFERYALTFFCVQCNFISRHVHVWLISSRFVNIWIMEWTFWCKELEKSYKFDVCLAFFAVVAWLLL